MLDFPFGAPTADLAINAVFAFARVNPRAPFPHRFSAAVRFCAFAAATSRVASAICVGPSIYVVAAADVEHVGVQAVRMTRRLVR
jgi:hypothetical protein